MSNQNDNIIAFIVVTIEAATLPLATQTETVHHEGTQIHPIIEVMERGLCLVLVFPVPRITRTRSRAEVTRRHRELHERDRRFAITH